MTRKETTRWNTVKGCRESNPRVEAFINDLLAVCEKHQLWLGHEDAHGGFIVTNEDTSDWINEAMMEVDQ